MFEWTRKYWEIGHAFYKEYSTGWLGQLRAFLMYLALPPCRKILAPDPGGKCIYVASFSEADRVEKMLRDMGEKFE